MQLDWSTVAALIGAVVAFVGYVAKRYLDLRLAAIERFHSRKFEAIVRVRGLLAEIDHSLRHLASGEGRYREVVEMHCASVRKESRAQSAVLGVELVNQIRDATDLALEFTQSESNEVRDNWATSLVKLVDECENMLGSVELRPAKK